MKRDNSLIKLISFFVGKYKIYFLALIILAISASIFEISVDYKIKEILDSIASNDGSEVEYLLFLFVFYKLMNHAVFFLRGLFDIKYKSRIKSQIIIDIYSKTVQHSLHWFDSHLSGEISNKIIDFQNSLVMLIKDLFLTIRTIVIISIALLLLSKVSILPALVLTIFVVIYTPLIYWLLKRKMQLEKLYYGALQESAGIINDSITNIFSIKIIGNIFTEIKLKLKPIVDKWVKWDKKAKKFETYVIDNVDIVMVVTVSAIQIYLLSYLYQNKHITIGGFAFAAITTLKIHAKLADFLEHLLTGIIPNIARVQSSYNFINVPLEIKDRTNAQILDNVKGDIKYLNVDFSYSKKDRLILSDFDLSIKPKERLGIVGMSGAGKTTLIKCLLRYFDINSGIISIDGNNIKDVSQESLRNAISVIPQDITMFHRSIKENIKLARYDAADSEIIAACKKAKIHNDILQMSNGYETIVGERGVKLSGGQRQRVAIARAILKNAPILILDEATSSLDTPTEQLIQDSLNEMLEEDEATVIAIAHRLSTLKHMDRIIVLDKGKIVEEGTHNGLIRKKGGLYKKLWEMQVI